ncbi:UNVERIFIED_CONTAM: hypothetical protein Sradi_2112200 [Sesamum radiatum]|uniref:Uncharacterized protein n=1 Tax=Sesamum radiatum TaxID=300843 RepID=A0AAW2TJ57_SESRA
MLYRGNAGGAAPAEAHSSQEARGGRRTNSQTTQPPTITESTLLVRRQAAASQPVRSSRAMVKSVEEVCRDIAWGEKREAGRIGLVLQDQLCRELIEEVVKELVKPSGNVQPLPLEACKRRLCF